MATEKWWLVDVITDASRKDLICDYATLLVSLFLEMWIHLITRLLTSALPAGFRRGVVEQTVVGHMRPGSADGGMWRLCSCVTPRECAGCSRKRLFCRVVPLSLPETDRSGVKPEGQNGGLFNLVFGISLRKCFFVLELKKNLLADWEWFRWCYTIGWMLECWEWQCKAKTMASLARGVVRLWDF